MANDEFDSALGAARRLAEDYLDGLRERPVAREVDPVALAAALDEPLPEDGCDPAEALAEWWRRAELDAQGTRVVGVYPGPVDTDMAERFDMPKAAPAQIAEAALSAVSNGVAEVYPDEMATDLRAQMFHDPAAVEKQIGQMLPA